MSDRKTVTAELKKYHQDFFDEYGEADFSYKSLYTYKDESKVWLFDSQIDSEKVFIETVADESGTTFSKRELYHYIGYNDTNVQQEYSIASGSKGGKSYALSLEKYFRKIPKKEKDIVSLQPQENKETVNITKLTIMDYTAIHLRVACADHPEINDVINNLSAPF